MSITHTAEEVINKAASILGKYVPGEALGEVEHETIDRCYDSVIAEIARIVVIGDRDQIPDLIFETVARLVALYASASFSNSSPPLSVVLEHEARLRQLIAQTPTYEPVKACFY